MTTIASDGKTVAGDTMGTQHDKRRSLKSYAKVVRKAGYTFGITGTIGRFPELIEWFLNGADPAKYPAAMGCDWCFLVYYKDVPVGYDNDGPLGFPGCYPVADGSGMEYALGALLAGASPTRAVEIAIQLDLKTGGSIVTQPVSDYFSYEPRAGVE